MLTYLCILLSKCRSYEMGLEFMPRAFLFWRVEIWVNKGYILSLSLSPYISPSLSFPSLYSSIIPSLSSIYLFIYLTYIFPRSLTFYQSFCLQKFKIIFLLSLSFPHLLLEDANESSFFSGPATKKNFFWIKKKFRWPLSSMGRGGKALVH